ncbi:hypothetical protein AA309_08800 [Microvirga vignae]|uniref:Uncharacterized protein n=1 Tax=Microvirga vignae TaxID=1225564 RepID=A0A0H1RE12_9HYPH|nr:hypothetical protein [Microvirga vignae]KLK93418.1 hypothetical protein AA309_08800 [Microvirga vignae]
MMKVSSSYQSTTSVSSVTNSTDPAGDSIVRTQSNDTTIGIQTGSLGTDSDDGTVAVLGGEAIAVGDDTSAIGTIEGEVTDTGTAVIAEGSASFTATGEASDGELAYASASTYGEASPSDTLVTVTSASSETVQTSDKSTWTETSTTDLLVVDFDLSNASGDSDVSSGSLDGGSDEQSNVVEADEPSLSDASTSVDLDGNLAVIEIDATAYGDESLVLVDASALTIEDELSVIGGYAWFGVG